jgi:hypothetical protein
VLVLHIPDAFVNCCIFCGYIPGQVPAARENDFANHDFGVPWLVEVFMNPLVRDSLAK